MKIFSSCSVAMILATSLVLQPSLAGAQAIDPEKSNTPETESVLSFFGVCYLPLQEAKSSSEYAEAARKIDGDHKLEFVSSVKIVVMPKSCSVNYQGPESRKLVNVWWNFKIDKTDDCKQSPKSDNGFAISCLPTSELPGYSVNVVRSGAGDQGQLNITLAYLDDRRP